MVDISQLLSGLTKETVYLIILAVYGVGVYVIITKTERPFQRDTSHTESANPENQYPPPTRPPQNPQWGPNPRRHETQGAQSINVQRCVGQPLRTVEDVLLAVGASLEKAERQRRGKPLYA